MIGSPGDKERAFETEYSLELIAAARIIMPIRIPWLFRTVIDLKQLYFQKNKKTGCKVPDYLQTSILKVQMSRL